MDQTSRLEVCLNDRRRGAASRFFEEFLQPNDSNVCARVDFLPKFCRGMLDEATDAGAAVETSGEGFAQCLFDIDHNFDVPRVRFAFDRGVSAVH